MKSIYALILAIFMIGCNSKDNEDFLNDDESDLDFTIRIAKNDNTIYFSIDHETDSIIIVNFKKDFLLNTPNQKLNGHELGELKNSIKQYIQIDDSALKYDKENCNCSITFQINNGIDEVQAEYKNMEVKDLSKNLNEVINTIKHKDSSISNFFNHAN